MPVASRFGGTVADVFISYRRAHRQKVEVICQRLEALGVSCWYDRSIESGDQFRQQIKTQLMAARAVIVCWTADCFAADDSGWVRWEAEEARNQKKLVPTKLELVTPEPPFNLDQNEDLTEWFGLSEHERPNFEPWQRVLQRLGKILGRPGLPSLESALREGDPQTMKRWSSDFRSDPVARRFSADSNSINGGGLHQLVSSEIECALPKLVHQFPYERNRMVFFTAEKSTRTAPAPVQSIQFSADGQRVIVTGGDGVVRHHWCSTGAQIIARDHELPPQTYQVTDFGGDLMGKSVKFLTSKVAFLGADGMIGYHILPDMKWGAEWGILNAFTGEEVFRGERGETPTFSERGDRVLVYRHDTFAMSLVELAGTTWVRRPLPMGMPSYEGSHAIGRCFFSDGKPRLLYRVGIYQSLLADPQSGETIAEFPKESGDMFSAEFPNDTPVVFSSDLTVYDATSGRKRTESVKLAPLERGRLLRSDGNVAALAAKNGLALIDLASGRTLREVKVDLGPMSLWTTTPCFSVAAARAELGMAGIVNLALNQEPLSLPDHGVDCSAIALSPLLDRVAIGRENGTSTVYRLIWK